jgi:hypothetical protein
MSYNFKSKGGRKIFNLLSLFAVVNWIQLTEGNAVGQFTETGSAYGMDFAYEHMVYIQGKNQNPVQAHTFLPGETPVTRSTIAITNNNTITKPVKIRTICYVQQNEGDPWVPVWSDEPTYYIKAGESLPVTVDDDAPYTAPAMPNTPFRIRFRVSLETRNQNGNWAHMLQTGNGANGNDPARNDTDLERHH